MELKIDNKAYLAEVQEKADKIIRPFIIGSFLFGIVLSSIHDTWKMGLIVGGMSVLLYMIASAWIKNRYWSRGIISLVFAIFMCQFIAQMHGMYEMHFVFFIYCALLIVYQDWRVMIPYAIVAIIHHTFFFYLQLTGAEGVGQYFINDIEVTYGVLVFHFGLVALMAAVCISWAIRLNKTSKENYYNRQHSETQSTHTEKNLTFITTVMQGNYDTDHQVDENDELGQALLQMRDNMKKVADDDRRRNWATEGLAKFADILRNNHDNIELLYDNIIANVVKYMNANQGALFILNDEDESEHSLEMVACYAYEKKKFIEKTVKIGQGLVGQAFLEKEVIHRTDIPKDYLKITSGLGESLPRNLLIVPLKVNEEVHGVLELASFNPIKDYQIEFLNKVGESIASTISITKINSQTKMLLEDSQQQSEEMRAQEEEMRQNMEELQATQEEMQRIVKEVQGNEQFMNDLISATSDTIFTVDKDFNLVVFNDVFRETWEAQGIKVEKGKKLSTIYTDPKEWEQHESLYQRALDGESFSIQTSKHIGDQALFFSVIYSPIRNQKGEVTAAAIFAKDITEMVMAKEKAEKLLEESQQQAEEMKAQEEEIRQNMEELQATQEEMERIHRRNIQILEQAVDAVVTIDSNKTITFFNKAAEQMFGYSREEVIGNNVKMIVPVEHRSMHDKYVDTNIKTGINKVVGMGRDLEMTRKDGSRFPGHLSLSKVEVDGEIQYTAFIKDLTSSIYNEREVQTESLRK